MPEIRAVQMDRVVPEVTIGPPATGERVKINIIDPAMATMLYLLFAHKVLAGQLSCPAMVVLKICEEMRLVSEKRLSNSP